MATFKGKHTEFFVSGPEVYYETAKVYCCREWEIVVATTTHSTKNHDAMPKRESWWVRPCGICGEVPTRRNV